MNAVLKSFNQMIKFWRKDIMLLAVSIAPILAGVFFKFGIPFLERLLTNYFEKEPLKFTDSMESVSRGAAIYHHYNIYIQ